MNNLIINLVSAPTRHEVEFCELVNEILTASGSREETTREEVKAVCALARHLKHFTYHVGSHHVSIHAAMCDGGRQLVLITGKDTLPDWN